MAAPSSPAKKVYSMFMHGHSRMTTDPRRGRVTVHQQPSNRKDLQGVVQPAGATGDLCIAGTPARCVVFVAMAGDAGVKCIVGAPAASVVRVATAGCAGIRSIVSAPTVGVTRVEMEEGVGFTCIVGLPSACVVRAAVRHRSCVNRQNFHHLRRPYRSGRKRW